MIGAFEFMVVVAESSSIAAQFAHERDVRISMAQS
jgi:hypothetical protein